MSKLDLPSYVEVIKQTNYPIPNLVEMKESLLAHIDAQDLSTKQGYQSVLWAMEHYLNELDMMFMLTPNLSMIRNQIILNM
ncbi:MAG: hypothetical protein ACK5NC_13755 [Vibrio sp.]